MNKKPAIIAIMIVLSIFLYACGNQADSKNLPTPTTFRFEDISPTLTPQVASEITPTQPTFDENLYVNVNPTGQVITFWHPFTGDLERELAQIIADFNASNQWGITLTPEFQASYSDLFDKMLAFMNTADAPDLVMANPEQAATYQLGNSLINLDELLYNSTWGLTPAEIEDIYPGYFQKDIFPTLNRQRLGIPLSGSMQVLYYNQNWLSELGFSTPPSKPEEFRVMACAAASQPFSGATADGASGYALNVDAANLTNWIFAFGGFVFDENSKQYNYSNSAAFEAMQFIQSLVEDGCVTLVAEEHEDRKAFSQGTALFSIDLAADLLQYRMDVAANAQFQWSIAPLPYLTAVPTQNISGPSVSVTRSTPEQQLAAWLFIKYFLSTPVQARWAAANGDFPVRASTPLELSEYFSDHPDYARAVAWLPQGKFEPSAPGYGQVQDFAAEAFFAITQGAEVANVLNTLTSDANANLAEQISITPKSSDPWVEVDPSGQTVTYWHQQAPARQPSRMMKIVKSSSMISTEVIGTD